MQGFLKMSYKDFDCLIPPFLLQPLYCRGPYIIIGKKNHHAARKTTHVFVRFLPKNQRSSQLPVILSGCRC